MAKIEPGAKSDGFARVNGKPAALLAAQVQSEKTVGEAVRKAVDEVQKVAPKGVQVSVIADVAKDPLAVVELRLPDAASSKRSEEIVARAEKTLRGLKGTAECLAFSDREANVATVLVKLPAKDAATPADIRKALVKEIQSARVRVSDLSSGVPFPVQIALADTGDQGAEKLQAWGDAVVKKLAADAIALDPEVYPGRAVPQLSLDIDQTKLKTLGVAVADVNDTLRGSLGDLYVNDFNTFGRTWQVTIGTGEKRFTPDDLKKLMVKNSKGEMVPLGTFVNIRNAVVPSAVLRVDLCPAVKITAAVPPGKSLAEVVARCVKVAETEQPGKNYRVIDLTAAKPR